ncbi:MAG TPA: 2-C-methyl-D-erythritol 4-phosphate cytidylyltransferase [Vicinamibacterales bacterium]|nr:2-C-methyl-D-erythritol 4-phosphate cytidylyltransferase [Vicinamibacterales bacterium]
MSVGVIIVAAGRGTRVGAAVPKQLLGLGGRSILRRSVDVFDRHPTIDALVVVLPAELVDEGPALVGRTDRPCRFVAGGARRQDSVRLGLQALPSSIDLVLVHDAARPFADTALIDRVIAAAGASGAAIPAVPARDTVKRVDPDRQTVTATLPRDEIWLAQTPQGFRRDVLTSAVALGDTGVEGTDEAVLVERTGHAVRVVPGAERNVKITTSDDLTAAREAVATGPRAGTGYDLHRLVAGRPLVLAGVTLPFDRGPLGHSDGDVLCHALIDAMLGAAAKGDIGRHFPNTDPQWRNAAGLDLLAHACAILQEAGLVVTNADVTVVLEQPKLAPHLDEIRARLAGVLGLPIDRVSVKGKTNEGVDAVGRGEAIAAHAIALVAPGARQ